MRGGTFDHGAAAHQPTLMLTLTSLRRAGVAAEPICRFQDYEHWGDELPFDLAALRRRCHAKCRPEKLEDDQLWCGKCETTAADAPGANGLCGPPGGGAQRRNR
jgi:hypothetical protein